MMDTIDRLDSWKEIAAYIKRDISTCHKWAKSLGLPVYRIDQTSTRSRVFSYKSEIDDWFKNRAEYLDF